MVSGAGLNPLRLSENARPVPGLETDA